MSRKSAVQNCPSSTAFRAIQYTSVTCSAVDWYCRKPNRRSGLSLLQVIIGRSLFKSNVSNIFDKTGSKFIGLWDLDSSAGLPDFKIMWISATLHFVGNFNAFNIAFKIYVLNLNSRSASSFSTFGVIKS